MELGNLRLTICACVHICKRETNLCSQVQEQEMQPWGTLFARQGWGPQARPNCHRSNTSRPTPSAAPVSAIHREPRASAGIRTYTGTPPRGHAGDSLLRGPGKVRQGHSEWEKLPHTSIHSLRGLAIVPCPPILLGIEARGPGFGGAAG